MRMSETSVDWLHAHKLVMDFCYDATLPSNLCRKNYNVDHIKMLARIHIWGACLKSPTCVQYAQESLLRF